MRVSDYYYTSNWRSDIKSGDKGPSYPDVLCLVKISPCFDRDD